MTVYLIHARTEPHVWILLEVIAVIAWPDTLETNVRRVSSYINYIKLFKVRESRRWMVPESRNGFFPTFWTQLVNNLMYIFSCPKINKCSAENNYITWNSAAFYFWFSYKKYEFSTKDGGYKCVIFCNQQTSMTVYLIRARTEPHVWIKLEVIAVIA